MFLYTLHRHELKMQQGFLLFIWILASSIYL